MEALRPIRTEYGTLPYLIYDALASKRCRVEPTNDLYDAALADAVRVWQSVLDAGVAPKLLSCEYADADVDPLRRANEPEMTYVYDQRVYKWFEDTNRALKRFCRATGSLRAFVPPRVQLAGQWLTYAYVPGSTLAERVDLAQFDLEKFLDWAHMNLWQRLAPSPSWAISFYRDKTLRRLAAIPGRAEREVVDAVRGLPWDRIADECHVTDTWHGDCSFENVVCCANKFVLLDWREDAVGDPYWDLAKLLKSIHFDHRKIDASGALRGHDAAPLLEERLLDWCTEHNYDVHKLWLAYALHWFAMSGRYDGPLGVNLYERGKSELKRYLG